MRSDLWLCCGCFSCDYVCMHVSLLAVSITNHSTSNGLYDVTTANHVRFQKLSEMKSTLLTM